MRGEAGTQLCAEAVDDYVCLVLFFSAFGRRCNNAENRRVPLIGRVGRDSAGRAKLLFI